MKFIRYFNFFGLFLLIFCAAAGFSTAKAQNFPAPREGKLLNGARLLVWGDSKTDKVTVKIRIHSGSAFDPLGKEGTMQLLSDILFPTETTREFFTEDLNGSFEIITNYDYIQINASGDADKFLTILETLASAVTNPQIDKETTAKVKAALLAKVQELEKNPAYVADRAVAKRLLGNFPYGRPQMGSSESLQKIDFADLLLADQKFFTADNATIAVSGNVNPDFALRAVKRLLGGWLKADKKVPSTFAQPDAPQKNIQILDSPAEKTSEFRFAVRGFARNDKNFYASQVLERILRNRILAKEGENSFARHNAHVLPGLLVFGVSDWNTNSIKKQDGAIALPETNDYPNNYLKNAVAQAEFDKAKSEFLAEFNKIRPDDFWLDAETFKLSPVKTEWQNAQNVMITDVQRVLEKIQKEPVASVLVFKGEISGN